MRKGCTILPDDSDIPRNNLTLFPEDCESVLENVGPVSKDQIAFPKKIGDFPDITVVPSE